MAPSAAIRKTSPTAARRLWASVSIALFSVTGALASQRTLLVPNTTLYPRDIIRRDHLTPKDFVYDPDGPSMYLENPHDAVGMAARTTLPANRPIPLSAIEKPRLVSAGTQVRISYSGEGINIMTSGVALQNGSTGDVIRVRNSESGVTVMGSVDSDGSIKVVEP